MRIRRVLRTSVPWPFPVIGVRGGFVQVQHVKPPLAPLREVPPPDQWVQRDLENVPPAIDKKSSKLKELKP